MQLLIVDVLKLVVERAVVRSVNLCNCFVEDEVGLVIDAHQLALKGPVILGGYSHPPSNVVLLQSVLGRGLLLHLVRFV